MNNVNMIKTCVIYRMFSGYTNYDMGNRCLMLMSTYFAILELFYKANIYLIQLQNIS